MSLFGTFTIAKQGLLAQQRALATASNNVANVNTPGYTRQRAVFEPIAPTPLPSGIPVGGGVEVSQVQRLADQFLDSQLQRERQELALHQSMADGLGRVESILEELDGSGIDAALSGFFNSVNDLATNPGDVTVRESALQKGVSLATLLNDSDRRLAQLQVDENQKVEQLATDISQIAVQIRDLNQRIFTIELGGDVASSLRDQRNNLLDELGKKVDFSSFEREDGQIAVFVGGGFFLVDSEAVAELTVQVGAGPTGSFFDVFQDLDGSLAGPITSRISGGELGAALELRDRTVPGFRDQLDELAFTLQDRINTVHLGGFGTVDATARRFFVENGGAVDPAGSPFSSISGAAGVIAVNPDLLANARHLAAGQTAGPADPGDNRNALALAAVEAQQTAFFQTSDPLAGPPTGAAKTLGEFYESVLGALGAESQAASRAAQHSELITAELADRRGALSGVSIDEEVADLIRFQRAYQASARVLQTVDRMLEDLLSIGI